MDTLRLETDLVEQQKPCVVTACRMPHARAQPRIPSLISMMACYPSICHLDASNFKFQ